MGQNGSKDNDSRNGGKKTKNSGTVAKLLVLSCIIVAIVGFFLTSGAIQGWRVTSDGSMEYSLPAPEYHLGEPPILQCLDPVRGQLHMPGRPDTWAAS
jgi:hypothetical protein